jgi:hypothetical protein
VKGPEFKPQYYQQVRLMLILKSEECMIRNRGYANPKTGTLVSSETTEAGQSFLLSLPFIYSS